MKTIAEIMQEVNISTEEFLKDQPGSLAKCIKAGMEEGIQASANAARITYTAPVSGCKAGHCRTQSKPIVDTAYIRSLIHTIK